MRWTYDIAAVRGIPIRVHASFLLILIWSGYFWSSGADDPARGALFGVVATLLLFACVTLHELGHAWQARAYGIGVVDITLYPIGGIARLDRIPTDPRRELRIALAGPAVNVAIAGVLGAVVLVADALFGRTPGDLLDAVDGARIGGLLPYLLLANIWLVGFNLIPALPMDGGRVLRALLQLRYGRVRATRIAMIVGRLVALGFVAWALWSSDFFVIGIAALVWFGSRQEMRQAEYDAQPEPSFGIPSVAPVIAMDPETARFGDRLLDLATHVRSGAATPLIPVVDDAGRLRGAIDRADIPALIARDPSATTAGAMRQVRTTEVVSTSWPSAAMLEALGRSAEGVVFVVWPDGRFAGTLARREPFAAALHRA